MKKTVLTVSILIVGIFSFFVSPVLAQTDSTVDSTKTDSQNVIFDNDPSLPIPEALLKIKLDHIHHPKEKFKNGTSTNWSGYAVETNFAQPLNNAVTDVKGQWTVPTLTCTSQNTYAAIWDGIDGDSDNTVEQTGTEQDCYNGTAYYYAWYEMYPRAFHVIGLGVKPGDVMSAEVKYTGNSRYVLTLSNLTTKQSFTTTQRMFALRQSAEWIVEAPYSGGVLPLSDFGTVQITNAQATLNGHTGNVADSSWQNDEITMVNSSNVAKATPSALLLGGSSFTVTWNSN